MALATKPKRNTVQHKKRSGKHHRQSKPYLKAYWPYLPMLLIVGAGIMVNSLWSNHAVLGASRDFTSSSLLSATNAERQTSNLPALTVDPQLMAAAQAKAADMVARNYWAHTSPEGKTPWAFIAASGYQYQSAGENLAYGFSGANSTVTGWMNSAEHRANVLDSTYENVGFGVASSPNYHGQGPETIVVAEYGKPIAAAANISFTVPNPTAPIAQVKGDQTELSARPVSRIQVMTGGHASWSLAVASALFGAALAIFIVRHSLRIHRLLSRGEELAAHHPYFDIAIVFVITAGFLLTRTSGLTR